MLGTRLLRAFPVSSGPLYIARPMSGPNARSAPKGWEVVDLAKKNADELERRAKELRRLRSKTNSERMEKGRMNVKQIPHLLLALLLLAACESFTGAAPRTAGPAPSQWGEALFARIGSTPEQVRAAIGEPTRRTAEGNRETWIYVHPDRPGWASNRVGTVTFLDGRVSKALMESLLTP